jgi:hypothetical protein
MVLCACRTFTCHKNEKGDNAFEFPLPQQNSRSLNKGHSQPSLHNKLTISTAFQQAVTFAFQARATADSSGFGDGVAQPV